MDRLRRILRRDARRQAAFRAIRLGRFSQWLGLVFKREDNPVELAKWELGVRTKTGDFFAVPVALAVGIGRLGCFHAGCCYGTPTNVPWGVVFPNVDELPRHPTQLYESAFHLSMAAVLFVLQRRGLFRGQLFKLYILSYLVYRFFTEMIRPGARLAGGLTGYQWVSLVLFGLFAWLWMRDAASLREGAALRA
jgi:phosphatidylglycerol:prolipoprotein diacylglycerol transferase